MFVQGSNGTIKIKVTLPEIKPEDPIISILDDAEIKLRIKVRKRTFDKECIIIDELNGEALCYLTPEDLCEDGNYEYQVIITYANGNITKSYVNSFYVQPSINLSNNL